jgi:hypothetical protein
MTWEVGRRERLSWALAARWCPVLSVTLGWDVAPVWPRGPLGDHVLVLLLLLVLAWRTVGARGGEHAEPDQGDVGAALAAA